MDKWGAIKLIGLSIVCVFGLVTCSAIESYERVRQKELQVELIKAEAHKAEAEAVKAQILNQKTQ